MKYCLTIISTLFILNAACSQKLVSFEKIGVFPKAQIQSIYFVAAEYDIDLYRVSYRSVDINQDSTTLSGLVMVPVDEDAVFPMHCNQHGTVADRNDVPSLLEGGYELGMIIASFGYVTIAPDFLGLGISEGPHPYIHAASEAWVAVDMLDAVKGSGDLMGFNVNDQLFISGYSQGGHAGMALHRELQQNHSDRYSVTAASHMSGPYSISERMIDFTLGDTEYFFVGYLVNVSISMKIAYPELLGGYELSEIFRPEYLGDIAEFENENIDLFELNERMIDTLVSRHGMSIPKLTMQDSISDAIINNPDHPFSIALADNDVYDWAPESPTRLFYCKGDDQVTWRNSELAIEVMTANGATEVEAANLGDDRDHGGCVQPALSQTIAFFNSLKQITSDTDDLEDYNMAYLLSPNPTNGILNIASGYAISSLELINTLGQSVFKADNIKDMDISHLGSGVYLAVMSSSDDQKIIQKLVKK